MRLAEQLPFLERLAKGVANLFGDNCEVTVHDLTRDYGDTVVVIANGHVSGRHGGDDEPAPVLKILKDSDDQQQDRYNYLARTKDGRVIKSSTVYMRDDDGKPIGLFGINYDVTDLIMAKNTLEALLATDELKAEEKAGIIPTNVADLLDQLIEEADRFVGKPVAVMTKQDKTQAIRFLSGRGAFLIKKAGDKVTKHYDISKYTLYNYLDAES